MKRTVTMTLDYDVVEKAKEICKKKRMSLSAEINEMLKEFVKTNG